MSLEDFDRSKFCLGSLCKRGHAFKDSVFSIRYTSGGMCVECRRQEAQTPEHRAKIAAYRQGKPNKRMEESKKYREKHKDVLQDRKRQERHRNRLRYKAYRTKNREQRLLLMRSAYHQKQEERLAYAKEYRERNREDIRLKAKAYRKTERFKLANRYHLALKRYRLSQVHSIPWTPKDWNSRLEYFSGKCAYCRQSGDLTIDHFISIAKGGENVFGNIVPACKSCNSSKRASDPMEWYFKQSFATQRQWKRILKILGRESNYKQGVLF